MRCRLSEAFYGTEGFYIREGDREIELRGKGNGDDVEDLDINSRPVRDIGGGGGPSVRVEKRVTGRYAKSLTGCDNILQSGSSVKEWISASTLAIGLLRSISLQEVSHRSSAWRRLGRDMPGLSGSKTPERAVRKIYLVSCELTMTLFSLRQVHWHAWMSRGRSLEITSMRSSLEREKRCGE